MKRIHLLIFIIIGVLFGKRIEAFPNPQVLTEPVSDLAQVPAEPASDSDHAEPDNDIETTTSDKDVDSKFFGLNFSGSITPTFLGIPFGNPNPFGYYRPPRPAYPSYAPAYPATWVG